VGPAGTVSAEEGGIEMTQSALSYVARTSENGVQTEMYLPKKWYFQRFVYDTLISGLKLEHVKKSLVENIEEVNELMTDFAIRPIPTGLTESRISLMRPGFWGYSVYDVDRAFCTSVGSGPSVDVERIQVIRVMFRTDIEDIQRVLGAEGMAISSEKVRMIIYDLYRSSSRELENIPRKTEASIVRQYLEDWLWDIQLFLFGYVIREICDEIRRLGESIKPADEIWVVSFRDTRISRITSGPVLQRAKQEPTADKLT
jgi:hypothetical protein